MYAARSWMHSARLNWSSSGSLNHSICNKDLDALRLVILWFLDPQCMQQGPGCQVKLVTLLVRVLICSRSRPWNSLLHQACRTNRWKYMIFPEWTFNSLHFTFYHYHHPFPYKIQALRPPLSNQKGRLSYTELKWLRISSSMDYIKNY